MGSVIDVVGTIDTIFVSQFLWPYEQVPICYRTSTAIRLYLTKHERFNLHFNSKIHKKTFFHIHCFGLATSLNDQNIELMSILRGCWVTVLNNWIIYAIITIETERRFCKCSAQIVYNNWKMCKFTHKKLLKFFLKKNKHFPHYIVAQISWLKFCTYSF